MPIVDKELCTIRLDRWDNQYHRRIGIGCAIQTDSSSSRGRNCLDPWSSEAIVGALITVIVVKALKSFSKDIGRIKIKAGRLVCLLLCLIWCMGILI